MTTFTSYKIDSKSKNAITIIDTFKVSFCLRNGHVYDARPVGSFTPAEGSIAFDYTFDAAQVAPERLEGISRLNLAKVEARKAEDLERGVIAYNKRKTDIINLWKWRHGNVTAYIVNTYERCEEYSDNSTAIDCKLFFSEKKANECFENVKNTSPDGAFGNGGWFFITELFELETTNDALEIMTIDDLTKKVFDHGNMTDSESYADPIPADHIIVDVYNKQHGGNARYEGCAFPRQNSFYFGSNGYAHSQLTYGDLAAFRDNSPNHWQVTMTITDAVEDFGLRVLEDLNISREDAIEAGVSKTAIEEYFTTETEE